jgi:hypothetical protein
MKNTGDTIDLLDAGGQLVDSVTYASSQKESSSN